MYVLIWCVGAMQSLEVAESKGWRKQDSVSLCSLMPCGALSSGGLLLSLLANEQFETGFNWYRNNKKVDLYEG